MIDEPTYHASDPVAACMGGERDDYWEVLVMIDVECETTYLMPKENVPTEFRKYGLPVWLVAGLTSIAKLEHREIKVTPELLKEQEEINKLVESFNDETTV